jgi:hypothetical protein
MHAEIGHVSADTATALNEVRAKVAGGSFRSAPPRCGCSKARRNENGTIQPWSGPTDIFITPGYRFRAVDVLMTNFHLPRSTLFMLVSAFCGLKTMREAYRPRHRDRLPLLFLWRFQPVFRSDRDDDTFLSSWPPTARRGAARSRYRARTISARRPSCRWARRHGQGDVSGPGARSAAPTSFWATPIT